MGNFFVTIHGSPHPHSQKSCLRTFKSADADLFLLMLVG